MNNGWFRIEEKLPEPIWGVEGEPPDMSDDVLALFPGGDCRIEVAYYESSRKVWVLPGHGFKKADCDPTHWRPLPELPGE